MKPELVEAAGGARIIRAVIWCVALAAIGYVGLSLWAGWCEVVAAVMQIGPWVLLGLLGLSLVNYLLRFFRWGRYLALDHVGDPPYSRAYLQETFVVTSFCPDASAPVD